MFYGKRINELEQRVAELEKKATAATAADCEKEEIIIPLKDRQSQAIQLFHSVQEPLSQSLLKTQQQVHEQVKQE
ncbi:hypothetical protein [Domibacillus epiphyticus]|uniref:Uncharacterized protein n=1 Tax=Domibacillus epiphyticus TaxID=1714355 RepID=A0A1V2A7T4_9BACI|nr:hypothetical protein [Domibacillus epiphyticus]OMP67058.1 hypothetical protein BTO28_08730 [Domibacillus epiphyticus]